MKNELILIKPTRHKDERGFFSEIYSRRRYKEFGIDMDFVQDNHSFSLEPGTLRGLHFQAPPNAQGKLVRCGKGAIFDVAVDIRKGSPTFGHWDGYELTEENGHQLYVPAGFAHGFLTLKPKSEIVYKCTDYYAPRAEGSIRWNDPSIGIEWPLSENIILNERDAIAPFLNDFETPFNLGENS
jgi:dTDP-4-dehydrorhamnose 3,5-epimerase